MASSVTPAKTLDLASQPVRIGTRKSALALKQTDQVISMLKFHHPSLECEVHTLSVAGDRDKSTPLAALGKGLWTNELEAQLISHQLDLVVHSLKDMPTMLPDGCTLGAVLEREDPRDVVVLRAGTEDQFPGGLADLPEGSTVGTSSVRRSAQLKRRFPGLKYQDVRGNIDTRLRKVDDPSGPFDAIILAAAGLNRMGFEHRITEYLDADKGVLHAVGQGGLGVEIRKGDQRILELLKPLIHEDTLLATTAERSVMRTLEGGCSVPIGVQTAWQKDGGVRMLRLQATVVNLQGTEAVDADMTRKVTSVQEGDQFGKQVAADLVARGASKILDAINANRAPKGPIGDE